MRTSFRAAPVRKRSYRPIASYRQSGKVRTSEGENVVRVIRRHHTVPKLAAALVAGLALAWGVWWSDWWADVPAKLGWSGALYETHVCVYRIVIPLVFLGSAWFEHRYLCLMLISLLLNLGYWGQWQLFRFYIECEGQLPLHQFLFGPAPGGCGFQTAWRYTLWAALATIPLAMASRWWSPRVWQDGTLCPHCGYCLRGLPELRCPECGRTPDPRELAADKLGLLTSAGETETHEPK